ncbi:MAG: hypothetical protein ACM3IH_11685 [Sphingobacteriales bacterium]|jgi:hypothetical protein
MKRVKRRVKQQVRQNDERCQDWCNYLEMLRQNPSFLSSLKNGGISQQDLQFGADMAANPPPVLLLAAAHFGLNLTTGAGTILLLSILADIVFRPSEPEKRGRPKGTKKWGRREMAKLGFHVAMAKAKNPHLSDNAIAGEIREPLQRRISARLSRDPTTANAGCLARP